MSIVLKAYTKMRSQNPTRRQHLSYWREDHGLRFRYVAAENGYKIIRKRGEVEGGKAMLWEDLVAYMKGVIEDAALCAQEDDLQNDAGDEDDYAEMGY